MPSVARQRRPATANATASAARQPTTDAFGCRSSGRAITAIDSKPCDAEAGQQPGQVRTVYADDVADDHHDERVGDEVAGDADERQRTQTPSAGCCGGDAHERGRCRTSAADSTIGGSATHAAASPMPPRP